MLSPFHRLSLRVGRVDLLPLLLAVLLAALVVLVNRPPEKWHTWFYRHLPF